MSEPTLVEEIDNWVRTRKHQYGTRLWLWHGVTDREHLCQITGGDADCTHLAKWFIVQSIEKNPNVPSRLLVKDSPVISRDWFWSTNFWGIWRLTASTHAATVWAEQLAKSVEIHRSTIYDLALPIKGIPDIVLSYLIL